ncbi:hypothetical protein [Armatimonas sp.]|uniref:hypothetical protein n=1 Tax=Armatimonas sp. TaxID=1872638 RepID=UPI00374D797D
MSSDESKPKKPFELSHLPIVLKAFKAGVEAALADHKRHDQSVVVWRDGKVVEVPPEDIPDFDQEEQDKETERKA